MNVPAADLSTRRLTGMGAVATLALAVLVFGCVLAATAGPREALRIRTQALSRTLATLPPLARSITVSTTWLQFGDNVNVSQFSDSQLSSIDRQFNLDFNNGVLHLGPVAADWVSMTTSENDVARGVSGTDGYRVESELSYRLPLTRYVRLLAGSLSAPAPRASTKTADFYPTINVAVTRQTAVKFGLQVGSKMLTANPAPPGSSAPPIRFKVAAIVAENQPGSSFWGADRSMAVPELNVPGNAPPYWTSGAFALPDESTAVQADYGPSLLTMQWVLPINFSTVLGDQAPLLATALRAVVTEEPALSRQMAAGSSVLTVTTGVLQAVTAFVDSSAAVDTLLWLLYVSLAVIAVIVLLLAARMVVLRRATELAMLRARGASVLQIGLAAARGAAIGCIPAAVLAGAAAVLLVPHSSPPGGWWPLLAVLAVAVGTPAVIGVWRYRPARSGTGRAASGYTRPGQDGPSQPSLGYGALGYRRRGRRRLRGGVRLVLEVTAVLAAIAGIVVFRQEGNQPGAAVNFLTSATPALVAVPAVIIVLRIYPMILRGLLRGAARGRGATGFLGLAQAARAVLTPALPAYALVLAITVAAFAGMVRDAVAGGEVSASWQAAGADVTISNVNVGEAIPVAAQRAFAAVPGVEHTAVVSELMLIAPHGVTVTALAVDPASYSALVASSRTWPAVEPGLLTGNGVLVSPQALAAFRGARTVTLTTDNGVAPLRVHVAGTLSGTPALTAGGAFVLMSRSLIAREPGVLQNLMLLNGPRIDMARLTKLESKMAPGAASVVRATLLRQLTRAPVQNGAFLLFAVALAAAAGLGLAVLLLQLALGAADREASLARLATMGLGGAQRDRLVLLEVIPAVTAAAVAAVASAIVLPRIVAPSINLSVFTGSSAGVPLVPDAASIGLPIAGLVVLAAVTLTIEIRARRGIVATLRGGE